MARRLNTTVNANKRFNWLTNASIFIVATTLFVLIQDEVYARFALGQDSIADQNVVSVALFFAFSIACILIVPAIHGKHKGVPISREYSKDFPKFEATGKEPYTSPK